MERRNHPRIELDSTVLYSKDISPKLTIASVLNLSMGGTRIETLYPLNEDEGLELSIAVGERAMKCRGWVKYALRQEDGTVGAGVEFEPLSKSDRVYLRQYLSHLVEAQAAEV